VKSQSAFGETLRRHRERSGVSIESIAFETKISASLLKALERGDCSRWPTGIYSRSYVREYAVAIGLDPDDLASQFSECFAQTAFPERPPELAKKAAAMAAEPLRLGLAPDPGAGWRIARRRIGLIVLDLLLIVVLTTALRMTVVANVWMALAVVTIGCHILGLMIGGSAASAVFARLFGSAPPEPVAAETNQEAAVEPA
jgi:transcriptional regulator with XRE-family HTH domain